MARMWKMDEIIFTIFNALEFQQLVHNISLSIGGLETNKDYSEINNTVLNVTKS